MATNSRGEEKRSITYRLAIFLDFEVLSLPEEASAFFKEYDFVFPELEVQPHILHYSLSTVYDL